MWRQLRQRSPRLSHCHTFAGATSSGRASERQWISERQWRAGGAVGGMRQPKTNNGTLMTTCFLKLQRRKHRKHQTSERLEGWGRSRRGLEEGEGGRGRRGRENGKEHSRTQGVGSRMPGSLTGPLSGCGHSVETGQRPRHGPGSTPVCSGRGVAGRGAFCVRSPAVVNPKELAKTVQAV